jgi:hypothetical protein
MESFGTFCTELADVAAPSASQHTDASRAQELSSSWLRVMAATCISAHWRGTQQRRRFAQVRIANQAAKRIQSCWAATMTRTATKLELQRIREEDRQLYSRLMDRLVQDWFQAKQLRRVEVHICSLSLANARRERIENYQALQAVQISRIFRLLDAKRDVIFVAPKALHEDVLDYFTKIMQFRGVKNPPGRFQIVVPENMDLTSHLSLSQGLLCSPKALRRIRKLVSGRQACIIPEVVTHTELKLCSSLQLPLMGAGPQNMALIASKSNAKKLAQLAQVPIGPWAVDIYDEDEFFTSLAGLLVKHPHVRTWLFKIDDERDARGHAYIDLAKMREVTDTLRSSVHAMVACASVAGSMVAESTNEEVHRECAGVASARREAEEPAIVGADANEVRHILRRLVPKRVCLCNRGAYPDFAAWMAEASRVGAVIQAVPDNIMSHTSVHLQIDPDGSTTILGSSEAAMCSPFIRAASFYPHTHGSWEVLHEIGLRMGRVLAGKGVLGFASVDVAFFDNPGFDPLRLIEEDREPTPVVIGGDTPIDPRHLMFSDLRSPSPTMSTSSGDGQSHCRSPQMPRSLPESRQADYDLAVQLRDVSPKQLRRDPVSMMLGSPPNVAAQPASRYACWVVDVDVRLTDEAAAMFPLQFVARLRSDTTTGTLNLAEDAAAPTADGIREPGFQEEEPSGKSARWALVGRVATLPGLDHMSHQSLFQTAKMRGVSFDLFHNVGCVFAHLDVVHSLFSLLTVDSSADQCAKRFCTAMGALVDGCARNGSQSGMRSKSGVSRDSHINPGRNSEMSDGLFATDQQTAVRTMQKRWSDRPRHI